MSIAYEDVNVIFQQLYEEIPDKGKKEISFRIQKFTNLQKKPKKSNLTAFKNIQLLLEYRFFFLLPKVHYRQKNNRIVSLKCTYTNVL